MLAGLDVEERVHLEFFLATLHREYICIRLTGMTVLHCNAEPHLLQSVYRNVCHLRSQ